MNSDRANAEVAGIGLGEAAMVATLETPARQPRVRMERNDMKTRKNDYRAVDRRSVDNPFPLGWSAPGDFFGRADELRVVKNGLKMGCVAIHGSIGI
jgi:hypothetical protein